MVNLEHPANAGILQHLKQLPNLGRKVEISQSPQSVGDPYTSLLTHPDLVMQLWDKATRKLPEKCSWIVYGRPVLVHPSSGIIFGYAFGSIAYALRLPQEQHEEAISKGVERTKKYPDGELDLKYFGEGWIFGKWLKEEEDWCLAAYRFAMEDVSYWNSFTKTSNQTATAEKVITVCPNCTQKLRAPIDRGELILTCPKCKHNWLWHPSQ